MKPARLFIALELPALLSKYLTEQGNTLIASAAYRHTSPEQLHITLKFLGDTDLQHVTGIIDAMTQTAQSFQEIPARLDKLSLIPPARPRTLICAVYAGQLLTDLHHELESLLADAGIAQPDRRPYRPHITLARLSSPPIDAERKRFESWQPKQNQFLLSLMTLYQSELMPAGAVYTPLQRVKLL